jgi:hypothetical protein
MQEHLQEVLVESLRRQSQQYEKQRKRQARSSVGGSFLLKVNGTKILAAAAKQRKRPRDASTSTELTAAEEGDASATTVLVALEGSLRRFECGPTPSSSGGTTDHVCHSAVTDALASLTGIELRHCRLHAQHIHSAEKVKPSVTQLLLSPARLWNAHAAPRAPRVLCTSVTTLDLECNALGDGGVDQLCSHLINSLPHLQRLLLASNQISAVGFLRLLRFLASAEPSRPPLRMETLGFTNNAVGCCSGSGGGAPTEIQRSDMLKEWTETVQAFVRTAAPTLRRVHLNHAGLCTAEAVALIDALLRYTSVFDLVYLRENEEIAKEEALRSLQQLTNDGVKLNAFAESHVSW